MFRFGLTALLVPCIGIMLEPLLREYVRAAFNNGIVEGCSHRLGAWKTHFN